MQCCGYGKGTDGKTSKSDLMVTRLESYAMTNSMLTWPISEEKFVQLLNTQSTLLECEKFLSPQLGSTFLVVIQVLTVQICKCKIVKKSKYYFHTLEY